MNRFILTNRPSAITFKPDTCSFEELEKALDCGLDGKAHRRLNTIHLLLVGATYEVARFNELGIDGLVHRPAAAGGASLNPTS